MKQILPDPDGSKLSDNVIAEYFRATRPETIPLVGFDGKLKRRQELTELIGRMEQEKKQHDCCILTCK